ncbi:MAG: carboxypeptidase-like regulatory domain-containing protein [Pyrinomonadaceae bacterium]
MKPVDGGRLCGDCSKSIVDFSKMSWGEIERIQRENNNSVCGVYLPKQIENWGRQAPIDNSSKFAATGVLLLSLTAASQTFSQNTAPPVASKENVIHGTVTAKMADGKVETLPFANISLKNTNFAVVTDEKGQFQIDLTKIDPLITGPVLVFKKEGYEGLEFPLSEPAKSSGNVDVQLNPKVEIIAYYLLKPTLGQRIKWRLKKIFHLGGR